MKMDTLWWLILEVKNVTHTRHLNQLLPHSFLLYFVREKTVVWKKAEIFRLQGALWIIANLADVNQQLQCCDHKSKSGTNQMLRHEIHVSDKLFIQIIVLIIQFVIEKLFNS